MGFFKDLNKLTKQAKALDEQYPVQDRLAQAQAAMTHFNQVMPQVVASMSASTTAATTGVDAVATITSARQTGAMMNHNPLVELDLMVMLNGVPRPVRTTSVVMQLHLVRAQPGQQVRVKVNPDNAQDVWIDWVSPA